MVSFRASSSSSSLRRALWLILIIQTATARKKLPRSSANRQRHHREAPWNPSAHIDDRGFVRQTFSRKRGTWEKELRLRTSITTNVPACIRQVPGDGNCLFHSLSLGLAHAQNGTHWDLNERLEELYQHSRKLRTQAVECLRQSSRKLFLQGRETLRAQDLVAAAAQQYDLTPEEYCVAMEEDGVWGGGPELVALANVYQRPIHIYELAVDDEGKEFVLRRMACFGSPKFDRRQALHILSADSRFPDLRPGQQLPAGNHFLAVFPQGRRRRRLRGGEEVEDSPPNPFARWWNRLLQIVG